MTIYQKILKATEGMHGWCEPDKQLTLANIVMAIQPRVIVEIGVWGGKSLIPMALAAQYISNQNYQPKVIAIDPWASSESIKGQSEQDAKWWGETAGQPQHELVYGSFLGKLMELGINRMVQVQRTTSDNAPVPESIGLFHCDGNHSIQALKDVQRFGPAITQGGVCVLDDMDWTGGGVVKAAEWLKENGFLQLHPLGTGACFIKIT